MRHAVAAFFRRLADRIDSPYRGRPRVMQPLPTIDRGMAISGEAREQLRKAADRHQPPLVRRALVDLDSDYAAAFAARDAEPEPEPKRPTPYGWKLRGVWR